MNNGIRPVKLFSTTGSSEFTDRVFIQLKKRSANDGKALYGCSRGSSAVDRFSNDNMQITVDDVRGSFAVIIATQTLPVSDTIMELLLLLHALKNSRTEDLLLVLPYMPYSRSDKKNQPRISSGGVLIPRILTTVLGVKRTLLLDPHSPNSLHYFEQGDSPCADVITAVPLLVDHLSRAVLEWGWDPSLLTVVFADNGAATRFGNVPRLLGADRAYIDKSRPDHSENPLTKAIVGDVDGRYCIIFDDEALTGGTAAKDAGIVAANGAKAIAMAAIHAPLEHKNGPEAAVQLLLDSPIGQFVFTDTVPCQHKVAGHIDRFTVLSVAPLRAEAISRIVTGESLTALYQMDMVDKYRS